MKKYLTQPRFWLILLLVSITLPALYFLLVQLSLPDGESYRIVQKTPVSSWMSALTALVVTPLLFLFDLIILSVALFFLYTMFLNIPSFFKKEIAMGSFAGVKEKE